MTAATLSPLLGSVLLQDLQVSLDPGVFGIGTDLAAFLCDKPVEQGWDMLDLCSHLLPRRAWIPASSIARGFSLCCDAPHSHPFSHTASSTSAGAPLGIPSNPCASLFSVVFPSPCSVPAAPLAVQSWSPTRLPQWLSPPCPPRWHSHDGRQGTAAGGDIMALDALPWELLLCICETADWEVESS